MIKKAIEFSALKHKNQIRKNTPYPYIVHPMEVMYILIQNGCSESAIIAGVLHDTVEDTNTTLEEIENEFGKEVAKIVNTLTENKALTWEERKQHKIDIIDTMSFDEKCVLCADKVSNLHSILNDYKLYGENVWSVFNRPKKYVYWYYKEIFNKLSSLSNLKMYEEYKNALNSINWSI